MMKKKINCNLSFRLTHAVAFLGFILLTCNLSSCKSHKKANREEVFIIEDVISVREPKKKKKQSDKLGDKIAREALTWIGTPYGYGRSDKGIATDCSGLVITVYEEIGGIKLPRNSAQQAEYCNDLNENEIEAGDLVFFATGQDKKKVSHVGIMIDKDNFVHASGSKGVILSDMLTPYYRRTFIKYGRVPN